MPTEPKLEAYLFSLDKALNQIPISDRADIITEIKSHILDAREKDPSQSLDRILSSLGEPETVANRYLLERGLKPGKPSSTPMLKWLTIGFLGTFAIFCVTVLILVFSFTPLISVDENAERVTLLGGLIDVDGHAGSVKIGSTHIRENSRVISGVLDLKNEKANGFKIQFGNGKLDLSKSSSSELKWECRTNSQSTVADADFLKKENGGLTLDFSSTRGIKCDVHVPSGLKTFVTGANGKIDIEKFGSDIEVSLSNGKVDINPDSGLDYKYDLNITNGRVEGFNSSTKKNAYLVKVTLSNGYISHSESD